MDRGAANPYANELIRGVFSTLVVTELGSGPTRRKIQQTVFVYVEEREDGKLSVQSLNQNFIPTGKKYFITKDKLLAEFSPDPSLYVRKVQPIMRRIEETVDKADTHRVRQQFFSAEFEYKNALRLDEEHIRATFGLGLTYLDRGDASHANLVFRRLAGLDTAFEAKHKHLFNEFGIKLRKNRMYVQALKYYARAYALSKDDEHLLYNMARTFYEKGSPKIALRYLHKAMALNPEFRQGRDFLQMLERYLQIPERSRIVFPEAPATASETPAPPAEEKEERSLVAPDTRIVAPAGVDDADRFLVPGEN